MSYYTVDSLDFKSLNDWPCWKCHFEQFCLATGLQDASAAKQMNTLLYCEGEEAKSMLISMNITDEEWKDYSKKIWQFLKFAKMFFFFEWSQFNRWWQMV